MTAAFALLLLTAGRDQPEVVPPDPAASRQLVRDALTLYGVGIIRQRQDRLVEATRCLEDAVRLDPDAVPPRQFLIPLYTALGRPTDAASTAAAVVVMDPSQAETWRTLARLLHEMKRTGDAISVLNRCVAAQALADRPADRIAAFRDVARLNAALGTQPQTAAACRKAIALLSQHRDAFLATGAERADLDREQAEFNEMLATASLAVGKFDDARDAALDARDGFRKANELGRIADIVPTLAAAYAGLGEPERAHALLDGHLAARPKDVAAFALKARLLREAGLGAAAIALLTRAANAEPDFVPLWVLLGDECRKAGDRRRAEHAYRTALEAKADIAAYRGLFAVLSGPGGNSAAILGIIDAKVQAATPEKNNNGPEDEPARRQREAAAEHSRAIMTALAKEPAAAGLALTAAVNDAGPGRIQSYSTWVLLANVAERANQLGMAEKLLHHALDASGPAADAGVYAALIRVLTMTHQREALVALCLKALAARRSNLRHEFFQRQLARSYAELGRTADALHWAKSAIELAENDRIGTTCATLVYALMFAEQFDAAEKECLKLLAQAKLPGEVQQVRHTLANVYSTSLQFEKAEEQLRLLLDLDPADAEAHNSLGYELADRGRDPDEAERLIRRALELDRARKSDSLEDEGENANYLDSLGWVLFRRGRYAEAKELIERAAGMRSAASVPEVWDHLGDICARMDKPAEAAVAWGRALGLAKTEKRTINDPRGAEIERKLKRLR
jgi:tetratricopeptide (TPR) repeat protein